MRALQLCFNQSFYILSSLELELLWRILKNIQVKQTRRDNLQVRLVSETLTADSSSCNANP